MRILLCCAVVGPVSVRPYLEVINMHIESCMQSQPSVFVFSSRAYCGHVMLHAKIHTSPAARFNRSNKLMVGFIELVIWRVHITFAVIVLLTKSDGIVCQYDTIPMCDPLIST